MRPAPDVRVVLRLTGPLDLARTVAPLRHGPRDPTIRIGPSAVWRATRTPDGPVTLELRQNGDELVVSAWGRGAGHAASLGAELAGQRDDPARLAPRHPLIRDLARRHAGLRLPTTGSAWEALAPAVIEQKVTGIEAFRAWRMLVTSHGEPAPGPHDLVLAPSAAAVAALPYHAFHRFGIERRRADTLRRAAMVAQRSEPLAGREALERRLLGVPGIGPWTVAEVARAALGDADAVSVGDFHLPHLVCWALAGEPRGDDTRMLQLLEPYRGQRARVQRLLEVSRMRAPRYGPRIAPHAISRI